MEFPQGANAKFLSDGLLQISQGLWGMFGVGAQTCPLRAVTLILAFSHQGRRDLPLAIRAIL